MSFVPYGLISATEQLRGELHKSEVLLIAGNTVCGETRRYISEHSVHFDCVSIYISLMLIKVKPQKVTFLKLALISVYCESNF